MVHDHKFYEYVTGSGKPVIWFMITSFMNTLLGLGSQSYGSRLQVYEYVTGSGKPVIWFKKTNYCFFCTN